MFHVFWLRGQAGIGREDAVCVGIYDDFVLHVVGSDFKPVVVAGELSESVHNVNKWFGLAYHVSRKC